MDILIKVAQLILSLSILILIHEFGHFLFAKIFKTRVEKFYLFFDPWFSIFKYRKGETEYGIGWLPLGGYVKISGMIDESMDKEQLKKPAEPYEFRSKPAWQRLLIMTGGVLMNVILALVIYTGMMYVWGDEYLPVKNMKYGVMVDSLGAEIGFQNGDEILYLDGEEVEKFSDISVDILLDEVHTVTVNRDGKLKELTIDPSMTSKMLNNPGFIMPGFPLVIEAIPSDTSLAYQEGFKAGDKVISINDEPVFYFYEVRQQLIANANKSATIGLIRDNDTLSKEVHIPASGLLGVIPKPMGEYFEFETVRYSIIESVPVGIDKGFKALGDYVKQFKLILNPETKAYESVGSFIRIGSIFPSEWDWQIFWRLTAFISIALAFLNMLPIPALDGGHVLFLLVEVITGKKPSDKFLEYAQMVGMIILIGIMLLAFYNDIKHFFF